MNNIEIDINIDKEPYIKDVTNHKIINITGESGSGKSYFCNKWKNDEEYIVVDTDIIFGNHIINNEYEKELRDIFKKKFNGEVSSALINNFDNCYKIILDYFKDTNKTIVIDSAQFRNMRDLSKLKGKIIVMRTSVNTCYKRCIDRYNENNPNASQKEKNDYEKKKMNMYEWYKYLNVFLLKVNKL